MITAAPLPAWGDLLAPLGSPRLADDALAGPWAAGAGRAYLLSRSAWSLAALVGMRKLEGDARPRLWLPDFFCNQSSAPARAAGVDIVFYPVKANFAPDWPTCRGMAERARPSLFVLVHYFGAANEIEPARTFCRETSAVLVEDAAHVLKPAAGIGRAGDFALYSPHKLLGVPDGAVLVASRPSDALRLAIADLPAAAPSPGPWAIKRALQRAIPAPLWNILRPIPEIPFERDPEPDPYPSAPRMSRAARAILARAASRLAAEAGRRRSAERILRQALEKISGWTPWPATWAEDGVPYRGVFICASAVLATERFARLRRAGCLVESWPDLAPEVTADPDRHRAAIEFRRRLLAFPLPEEKEAAKFAQACAAALA
jgi:hypothetical protein